MEGMLELAILPQMEVLVTAIVGMIGIRPTIAAIKDRQCQHAERCQKNHHVGDRPLGAFHAA